MSLLAMLLLTSGARAAGAVEGTFALQDASAKVRAYMVAGEIGHNALDRHFDFWMTAPGAQAPIRSYDVSMTKYLHLIIVSADFQTFLHVHPILQADGHFILDQMLPSRTGYYVYADVEPSGVGQQVFRFDLDLAGKPATVRREFGRAGTEANAGPYVVRISSDIVAAGSETRLTLHVFKSGEPAKNLHPYLGALAHVVFLNVKDLSYVHVHPMPIGAREPMTADGAMMEMKPLPDTATSSPNMALHVRLSEPGTYKAWIQFRGGGQLYVAPFVITAT